MSSDIRAIAIHLPQFHPFPENDEWWGKGFTEWTNVTKAKPLFKGHYQPHLPTDLGFYDLRLEQSRIDQANLARENLIHGFCYYHYWFDGKRLMNQPLDALLRSKVPDLPFMFCWANENWSRRWDGGNHEVLIQQNYSGRDAEVHCRCLIPFFLDDRYIRVNGKPVFCIYKPQAIPHISEYLAVFKAEARKCGVELYLCYMENYEAFDGGASFDAAIEFQPWSIELVYLKYLLGRPSSWERFGGRFLQRAIDVLGLRRAYDEYRHRANHHIDYGLYVDYLLKGYRYPSDHTRFPCVTPMWDSTARLGKRSFLFRDPTPEKYAEWLQYHMDHFKPPSKEENFIFINAWNEWAEGNHLEPCIKWGISYLDATRKVLQGSYMLTLPFILLHQQFCDIPLLLDLCC